LSFSPVGWDDIHHVLPFDQVKNGEAFAEFTGFRMSEVNTVPDAEAIGRGANQGGLDFTGTFLPIEPQTPWQIRLR
jgi:hypothetical protein